MKHIALLGCLCLLAGGCSQPAEAPEPIPVIFDTDPGNDIDDVLALQMLLNYHKEGRIDLRGIGIGKMYPRAIEYVDAYCRHNGLNDIPLGYVYDGANPLPEAGDYVTGTLEHADRRQTHSHPCAEHCRRHSRGVQTLPPAVGRGGRLVGGVHRRRALHQRSAAAGIPRGTSSVP